MAKKNTLQEDLKRGKLYTFLVLVNKEFQEDTVNNHVSKLHIHKATKYIKCNEQLKDMLKRYEIEEITQKEELDLSLLDYSLIKAKDTDDLLIKAFINECLDIDPNEIVLELFIDFTKLVDPKFLQKIGKEDRENYVRHMGNMYRLSSELIEALQTDDSLEAKYEKFLLKLKEIKRYVNLKVWLFYLIDQMNLYSNNTYNSEYFIAENHYKILFDTNSSSLLERTILYAEYLAIQQHKSKNTLTNITIEKDIFQEALEETYSYLSQDDPNYHEIKSLAHTLNINTKKRKKIESYRDIVYKTHDISQQKRLKLSSELFEIIEPLKIDEENINKEFVPILTKFSIFGFKIAKRMKQTLSSEIFGQDRAIDMITDAFKDDLLIKGNMPRNIFFFLGPPGTGKTLLGKSIAALIPEYQFKVFDMTQYNHKEAGMNLTGTLQMWGNAKTGELTSFVKENPRSVILFDEFDKAHTDVQNSMLSLLNDGYIDDACGWFPNGEMYHKDKIEDSSYNLNDVEYRVEFNETIIIFTTNMGAKLYNNFQFMENFERDPVHSQQLIYDVLAKESKVDSSDLTVSQSIEKPIILPHFLSRLMQSKLVLFERLDLDAFVYMASNRYEEFKQKLFEKYSIVINCKENDLTYLYYFLILQQAPNIDARNVDAKVPKNLYNDLIEQLEPKDMELKNINSIVITISKQAKSYFNKYFKDMIKDKSLIKYFFRKNLSFKISTKSKLLKKEETIDSSSNHSVSMYCLDYTISSIDYQKIQSVGDFEGDDALVVEVPNISFEDIAGHNTIKHRLKEIVGYLKDDALLDKYDIETPRGLLMYGKPGTGKTMLARAFAYEADLPIIQTTGANLLVSGHIQSIYKKAKEYAPSIVFIDEIDAIGRRDGDTYKDMLINQFLTELNGFNDDKEQMVFTIAATNFRQKIDTAILRSGRIDLHIEIDILDKEARGFFIDKILKKPNDGDIDRDKIIFYTAGMTGADLEKVLRESALETLRQKDKLITQEIIIEQINIIKYGQRRQVKSIGTMLEQTAYHEAGHAVVSQVLFPQVAIEQITIAPRERLYGLVSFNNEDRGNNLSKEEIENKIAISFAGRISEMKKFGNSGLENGASSDLESATRYAYLLVAHYGMDEELGYINIDGIPNLQYNKQDITDSTFLQSDIEKSVKSVIKKIEESTKKLVDKHWDKINEVAQLLMKKEVLEHDELNEVL